MRGVANTVESLWEFIEPEPNTGCWLWTGTWHRQGWNDDSDGHAGDRYGVIRFRRPGQFTGTGPYQKAHRVVYEAFRGEIPLGLELDHKCRLPVCVNPAHLEPVTHLENMRRGGNARKQTCPQGHPYSSRRYPNGRYFARRCLICNKERQHSLLLERGIQEDPVALNKRKVACPRGHPYDKTGHRHGKIYRYCSLCHNRKGT